MPCLAPVKITYSGLETFTAQQISNYLEITPKLTWIQFDSAKAASKLAANAVIENVVIEKQFPDKVFINVVERKATSITLANVNGKTVHQGAEVKKLSEVSKEMEKQVKELETSLKQFNLGS